MREVVQLNSENEVINSFKIRLNDKVTISHGNFKAFLSYCDTDKLISFLGYQFVTCSFFTFSLNIKTREETQHVATMGGKKSILE